MNILSNIKKIFVKNKRKNPNDLINNIIGRIQDCQKNLKNKPRHLTEDQWQKNLALMLDAFLAKKRKLTLKSKAKRRREKIRIDKGFDLFKIHIKDL